MGRGAAVLLPALFVFLPSAAQAQQRACPRQTGPTQNGQMQGLMMNAMGQQMSQTSMMSQMSQMSQMCGMRSQTSQLTTTQPGQPQFGMQQVQMAMIQQAQLIAMQQMQMNALRPPRLSSMQQSQQTPPLDLNVTVQTQFGRTQQKQTGELLRAMDALQTRMDALQQAADRKELRPSEASAAQHEVLVLQDKVDALAKPAAEVLNRMSALKQQSDDLLQEVAAKPADVIAALRSSP
jgi:hypothetical protein